jgi:hypothetical protein
VDLGAMAQNGPAPMRTGIDVRYVVEGLLRGSDRIPVVLIAMLVAGASLWPQSGAAEGALAVGLPNDVAAEGFAFGHATNKSSADQAGAEALAMCQKRSPGVDPRAQALCAVVQTFRDKCFAVAMDPKDATPGVGWAVAANKTGASDAAMSKCRDTAGADRRDACEVSHAECDGAGQ